MILTKIIGKKDSIARRMLFAVILMSSAMTILTSAYQLYGNFQRYITQLNLRLQEIEKIHVKNLSKRLWTADIEALQMNLDEVALLPDINYLEVQEKGVTVAQSGKKQTKNQISKSFKMVFKFRGELQQIGVLNVQGSLNNAYHQVLNQIFDILISNAIKIFFLAGFILYIFNRLITRHLEEMALFAAKINISSLDNKLILYKKIKLNSAPDEIDLLANAFTKMQENLEQSVEDLQQSESQVRLLLNSAAEAIYGIDNNGRCTFANNACLKMLKYSSVDQLIGKNMHELIHHSYPDGSVYPVSQCHIFKAFNNANKAHIDTEVFWRKDGSSFPIEYWSYPIIKDGNNTGAVVTFIDITQRKKNEEELAEHRNNLEQLISERTTELVASNKELEAFSYSVSHDLRAPLRGIDGFSQVLLEDYSEQLDETGKGYLQRIRKGSQTMGHIISDLLLLSQVTRQEINISSINITSIVSTVIERLKDSGEREFNVTIEENLTANADENLVPLVIDNLLRNAYKYTSKNSDTLIEVGSIQIKSDNYFYIKDNGVGFDMQYSDKIFQPFQRLHAASDYQGTGIGLATVARVIQRHGGDIFAESKPDEGATFYFHFG